MVKDPDDQVRSAIAMIFARFEQLGAAHSTQTSMAGDGLLVPVLRGRGRKMLWQLPRVGYLLRVLKIPLVAGA